ncbi:uncharacterized protein LOC132943584 [Metopolophium dirhodum]|uniref:uncharacterized protein LOC132943584 n=1 Tax=Metopolophium dirhodum TaxID=44670 RepID=UPI002990495E|nr:uncharacterized protein LOC132943584 [Metopolophium dirhodum]
MPNILCGPVFESLQPTQTFGEQTFRLFYLMVEKIMAVKEEEERARKAAEDIEINEAFDLMDTHGHKIISTRDFKFAIKALGLELPRDQYIQLLSRMERDQNGFIKKEIFIEEMRKVLPKRDVKIDMIKAFQLIDEDDTGKIDFNNLKNVATILGEQVSDEEIINMLNAADEDGDGQVNLTEFMRIIDRARKVL